VHEAAIDSLAEGGIAAGCNQIDFCPSNRLTRAQGATFVARSLDLVERTSLAPYAERRAAYDREREQQAQARTASTSPGELAVEEARRHLGKPYRYGGNGPGSFDCSGLTRWAWNAAGVHLPRTSRDQYRATQRVSRSDLRPGDLVFYYQPISHVAIYLGDGRTIEAPRSGGQVRIANDGLTRSGLVGFGRPR
jgi:cell wall-associated NlpC family hydrolase